MHLVHRTALPPSPSPPHPPPPPAPHTNSAAGLPVKPHARKKPKLTIGGSNGSTTGSDSKGGLGASACAA